MLQEIKTKRVRWVLATTPTKSNLAYLWENFPMSNEDLAATLPPLQRPRVMMYRDYLFMILQFPYIDKATQEIKSSEIDFFIGKGFVITVTDGKLKPLNDLFDTLHDEPQRIHSEYKNDLGQLLYTILDSLQHTQFPLLNSISQSLDDIEQEILDESPVQQRLIYDILNIKRNVVNFRKITQTHRDVIKKLVAEGKPFFNTKHLTIHVDNLIDHSIETWSSLENYRETINALHETYESLINYRTNLVMKTLTIFSVIVFPLTLLAAIFGMNTQSMPLVDHPYGFWIIVVFMVISAVGLYGYFKNKKWI